MGAHRIMRRIIDLMLDLHTFSHRIDLMVGGLKL